MARILVAAPPLEAVRCILCSRTLQDPESKLIGIGPVCLSRTGVGAAELGAELRRRLVKLALAPPGPSRRTAVAALGDASDPVVARLQMAVTVACPDVVADTDIVPRALGPAWSPSPPPDWLTAGQQEAFRTVLALPPKGRAVIIGYAGTGKTTQMKATAEALPGGLGGALVLAPTGKAALRVREATGIPRAMTIHRWCYRPVENPKTGEVTFQRGVPALVPDSGIVFVDEASMIGRELWDDLTWAVNAVGCKLVLLGDGFQLPPVDRSGAAPFSLLTEGTVEGAPYVRLTEVKRQGAESPVLRASMQLRDGDVRGALATLPGVPPARAFEAVLRVLDANGAVIVHRNATRTAINRAVRAERGLPEGDLGVGEPLLVTQNNYGVNLYNGEIVPFQGWIVPPTVPVPVYDRFTRHEAPVRFGLAHVGHPAEPAVAILALEDVDGTLPKEIGGKALALATIEWAARFASEWFTFQDVWNAQLRHYETRELPPPLLRANHGYAMTCHKMQGSQAPLVFTLIEPTVKLREEEGRRWLYTAITRAEKTAAIAAVPWGWP